MNIFSVLVIWALFALFECGLSAAINFVGRRLSYNTDKYAFWLVSMLVINLALIIILKIRYEV